MFILLLTLGFQPATEPLKVEGDVVITVKNFPITVKAPKANFVSWHYPQGTVVERRDNGDLLIHALPQGEAYIWADCGIVNFEEQKTEQFIRSVTLLNGYLPRPPPIDPENPENPDVEGPKQTVIVYDELKPIPTVAEGAVNELREDGETVFFVNAGTTTTEGNIPAFLKTAITEAKEQGLPAIVVMKGETVIKSDELPDTKEEIIAFVEDGSQGE